MRSKGEIKGIWCLNKNVFKIDLFSCFNPLGPCVLNIGCLTKILFSIQEGIIITILNYFQLL